MKDMENRGRGEKKDVEKEGNRKEEEEVGKERRRYKTERREKL